jgi:hypothetical protein
MNTPFGPNVTWICEECLAVNVKPACADNIFLCDCCAHPMLLTPYLEERVDRSASLVAHP